MAGRVVGLAFAFTNGSTTRQSRRWWGRAAAAVSGDRCRERREYEPPRRGPGVDDGSVDTVDCARPTASWTSGEQGRVSPPLALAERRSPRDRRENRLEPLLLGLRSETLQHLERTR